MTFARRLFKDAAVLAALALTAAMIRSMLPGSPPWTARWPSDDTPVEEAYRMISRAGDPPLVTLSDAIDGHRSGASLFIDARKAADFEKGRIKGARSLPFYEYDTAAVAAVDGLPADRHLVIYCEGPGCELSLFLARRLNQDGFTNVGVFYGGYPEWKAAGLPVEP